MLKRSDETFRSERPDVSMIDVSQSSVDTIVNLCPTLLKVHSVVEGKPETRREIPWHFWDEYGRNDHKVP